ncbi:MAG: ABC transporter substrate-binding protein [Ilumatobacteraceae bacterium]
MHTIKYRSVLGALAAAALVVSACSDDDKQSTDTDATVADTTPTTPDTSGSDTTASDLPLQIIKIGYAFPDLASFAVLNKDFAIGDPGLQAEAVVDGWRRDGLLPPGIEIELVAAAYNIIDPQAKQGVCTQLAEDEDVFAVVSGISFTVGAECLATRYQIPVIDTDGGEPSLYERGAPWLFTLRPDTATQYVGYGQWAIDSGELDGKRVGMYFETKIIEGVTAMRELFDAEGVNLVSVTETSGVGIGGAEDTISVERFIAEDVEVVLPLVGGSSAANMYNFAEGQGYRPLYLDMDYSEHTTDVAAKTNPDEQYDGVRAMSVSRVGERAGGIDNPGAEACIANYERYAAVDIPREGIESGEYSSILRTCDLFAVLLTGLTGAADDLTRENFVTALENGGTVELVGSGNGSFSADDHSFIDEFRTIQWDAACPCWKAISDFAPLRR